MAKAPSIDHNGANVGLVMAPALISFTNAANQFNTGAGGATTVVTADANAGSPNVIQKVQVSFSAAPAAGTFVQIKDGTNVVWKMFVNATQLTNEWTFQVPLAGTVNTAMTVTVSDPGGVIAVTLFANIYTHK